jgi:hypothetical protein
MNRKSEKNTCSQTSRLETSEEPSATPQSRKNPVFDCAVALCSMQNALVVISNLT